MVAVPLTSVVQREHEQVAAVEGVQRGSPATPSGHRIAQRPAEPPEDGRVQQEVTDRRGLTPEDLLHEVVHDVAVVTGEAGDEPGGVISALHRQRGQLEGDDPSLGAPLQSSDVLRRQVQSHHVVEIGGSLLGGEAEVGGADLDQLSATTQPCQ